MTESERDLGKIVDALREPVEVRPAWRDALLRELGDTPLPRHETAAVALQFPVRRLWTVRPVIAVAASLLLLCGGVWIGSMLSSGRGDRPRDRAAASGTLTAGAQPAKVTVRFHLVARTAGQVSVVGDFNRWNPAATPMRRARDGQSWIVEVPLAPGRHVYAFVVDGDVVTDPAAPLAAEDDFGVPNSIVLVGSGGA